MSASRRSILFLTHSEHGQANVHLATAWELLRTNEYDLHLASYAVLKPRIEELNMEFAVQHAYNSDINSPKVSFHELPGVTMTEYARCNNIAFPHSPSYNSIISTFSTCARLMVRDDHDSYIKDYDYMVQLIKNLNPVVVVVDRNCYVALDVCLVLGVEYIQMSPCSFYEDCVDTQPYGRALWKYPAFASGYSYPVPWYLIPLNIFRTLCLTYFLLLGPLARSLNKVRTANGIKHILPISLNHNMTSITPSLPEIDHPFTLPSLCHGVGPIMLPAKSVEEVDKELAQWLSHAPTILVNLGTLYVNTPESARSMARALATILTQSEVQVLWKLKYDHLHDAHIMQSMQSLIDQDRVRITPWIKPEASAILADTQIVAFVHHGGMNSFFEACYAGVPQVVLPAWLDCYSTAVKVEYLGIGIYGNRTNGPEVDEEEFIGALSKVLSSSEMRQKAEELGRICRGRRSGRERAGAIIGEVARKQEGKQKKHT